MEKINNKQLKEVVRDFLLTTNPGQPLIIWGKNLIGKTEIIDGVISEMNFFKLLDKKEKYSVYDTRIIDLLKSLKINIGSFDDDCKEQSEYMKRFTCGWIIKTQADEGAAHIIIEAAYDDEQIEQSVMLKLNNQCDAIAYIYELTLEDWLEWADLTHKVNPFYLRFINENPNMFCMPRTKYTLGFNPSDWVKASNSFNKEVWCCDFPENKFDLWKILYVSLSSSGFPAAQPFKEWLEKTYGVRVGETNDN